MNLQDLTKESLAKFFDHTNLKPTADRKAIEKLCEEAKQYGFASVMVNSAHTTLCRELIGDAPIRIGTVAGFPLGQMSVDAKVFEARTAIADGADEIDYVVNLSYVKNGEWDRVREEMERITSACHRLGAGCKVILETCFLEKAEIVRLCEIAREVKPDFVKPPPVSAPAARPWKTSAS